MVPSDQFYRMAALALIAILLLLTFACQAYASGPSYIDSGIPPGEGPGTLLGEVFLVRQMLEFLIFTVIPCICAVWLIYKFCMWFYHTFVGTVL